jgi:hypothetical protein
VLIILFGRIPNLKKARNHIEGIHHLKEKLYQAGSKALELSQLQVASFIFSTVAILSKD